MGYIRHHVIVITACSDSLIDKARCKAAELGLKVLGPSELISNSYRTIVIPPDGSKEGWGVSNLYNARRSQLCYWLHSQHSKFEWFEAYYGNDDSLVGVTDQPENWEQREVSL